MIECSASSFYHVVVNVTHTMRCVCVFYRTMDTWNCPRRLGGPPVPLDNSIMHKDSAYNNNPNTPEIMNVSFEWAPVLRNGTNPDGSGNFVSDIPKCGKVV